MNGRFVAYYRVSTTKQGLSGLGLEAQKAAVLQYLNGGRWTLAAEFTEIESGKSDGNRPELQKALTHCRLTNAKLIIAKLDRLSRDAHFLLGLEGAGIDFQAADMPDANRLTVGIMAVVAEAERRLISDRTKAALAAAKARGTKLGGARPGHQTPSAQLGADASKRKADARSAELAGIIVPMREAGDSLRVIAARLTEQGISTANGGQWTATAVKNALARLG